MVASNLYQAPPQLSYRQHYDEILAQQREKLHIESAVQVFLLELVAHSSRPLRLLELADALSHLFPDLGERPKEIVPLACGSLLRINDDETCRIADETIAKASRGEESPVVELDWVLVQSAPQVHRKLAVVCLGYLRTGKLEKFRSERKTSMHLSGRCETCDMQHCECRVVKFDRQAAYLAHPFLDYAIHNWLYHLGHYDVKDRDIYSRIESFIASDKPDFFAWACIGWFNRQMVEDSRMPTALHVAAYAGLTEYSKILLDQGAVVDAVDEEDQTPLWFAAFKGKVRTCSLLLEKGANPDHDNLRGSKPLHQASRQNHYEVVRLLLQAGVNLLTPKSRENRLGRIPGGGKSTKGETAVEYVCESGYTESISEMIPFADDQALAQLLCECALFGHHGVVRVLLSQSEVSPDAECHGATALFHAARGASTECVELLLEKGADIDRKSEFRFRNRIVGAEMRSLKPMTPLQIMIRSWNKDNDGACKAILKMFQNSGVKIDASDEQGMTLLHQTLPYGRSEVHCLRESAMIGIVEAGADVSALHNGDTFLMRVIQGSRNVGAIEFLLEHGGSLQTLSESGRTVWHALLNENYNLIGPSSLDDIAACLMKHGAGDLRHLKDENGLTALELAAGNSKCSFELFKTMLHACPDKNARKNCHERLRRKYRDVDPYLKELVAVQVAAQQDGKEMKELAKSFLAKRFTQKDIQAALDAGYQLSEVDAEGRNLLHHCVSQMVNGGAKKDILKWLVSMGLDPRNADHHGNTILHDASRFYTDDQKSNGELVAQIMNYGLSPNKKNIRGRTALHAYFGEHRWVSHSRPKIFINLKFLDFLKRWTNELDIDAKDENGFTALHEASMRSEFTVGQLLSAGADPSLETDAGDTVLHLAARARMSNIVGLLLNKTGSSLLEVANELNETPLHLACRSGQPESVYYLLKAGAKVDVKDHNNRNLLHACVEFLMEQKIWKLPFLGPNPDIDKSRGPLRPGANMDLTDDEWFKTWRTGGITIPNRIAVIKTMLLQAGVDSQAEDSVGLTPSALEDQHADDSTEAVKTLEAASKLKQDDDAKKPDKEEKDGKEQDQTAPSVHRRRSQVVTELTLQNVLEKPQQCVPLMSTDDVDFLLKTGEDTTGETRGFKGESIMHAIAKLGRAELMERFEHRVQIFGDIPRIEAIVRQHDKKDLYTSLNCESILSTACRSSNPNLQMIVTLIEVCGADVNGKGLRELEVHSRNKSSIPGLSALHILAKGHYWWHVDAIRYLIQKGANIEDRNENGETPLHIAAQGVKYPNFAADVAGFWAYDCAQVLISAGADPNVIANNNQTPLSNAGNSPDITALLLSNGADLTTSGHISLFSAIHHRNADALKILLDAGADPNALDKNLVCRIDYRVTDHLRTALLCASFADQWDGKVEKSVLLIRLLVERGADIYASLNDSDTLVHYVFEHAYYMVNCAYLDIADKIDFETQDRKGRTVLLASCDWTEFLPSYRHDHWYDKETAPVIRLLDMGANVLATDHDGRNALHHAFDNADLEQDTLDQLLSRDDVKPLIKQKDKTGYTPLHLALRTLRPPACEKLISLGADLMEPDPTGATALHHIAAQYLRINAPQGRPRLYQDHKPEYYTGCLRLWNAYLSSGRDINTKDEHGDTPLFFYLRSNFYKIEDRPHVRHFAELFETADVGVRNTAGESALHVVAAREVKQYYATIESEKELFAFLMGKGLDPRAEDGLKRSALDVAAVKQKTQILELA